MVIHSFYVWSFNIFYLVPNSYLLPNFTFTWFHYQMPGVVNPITPHINHVYLSLFGLLILTSKHMTSFWRCNNVIDVQATLLQRQNDVVCLLGKFKKRLKRNGQLLDILAHLLQEIVSYSMSWIIVIFYHQKEMFLRNNFMLKEPPI